MRITNSEFSHLEYSSFQELNNDKFSIYWYKSVNDLSSSHIDNDIILKFRASIVKLKCISSALKIEQITV
jgi:hypothetical protein